jgi:protocatechuate 3,4-dioxygenase beta subunit
LLREVTTKLQNNTASVSAILSDKTYLSIHPLTDFRELIKANCTPDILTITTPDEPGKKIRVLGTVTDKEGKPVAGALVYLYQTDYRGWYAADAPHVLVNEGDMRHARLFGYVKTDAKGKFELHTVKPHGYPNSELPAHIHVHVVMAGYQPYVSEFLFDDDERLVGKIRERSVQEGFLIVRPEKATAPFDQQFSYSITLNKQ